MSEKSLGFNSIRNTHHMKEKCPRLSLFCTEVIITLPTQFVLQLKQCCICSCHVKMMKKQVYFVKENNHLVLFDK